MKKYFIQLYPNDIDYGQIKNFYTKNFALQYLWFSLYRPQYDWVHISKLPDKVLLWSSDYTKQMADFPELTSEEKMAVYLEYRKYVKTRWDNMPKLEMSVQNYEEITEKWKKIIEQKPQYIIFSQDDNGYVDLIGKQEFSEQDLQDMKIEHEKYLRYKKAWDAYEQANPDRSEVWRSSADDEYEADWQKYYDQE